jgi:hypothetical protein
VDDFDETALAALFADDIVMRNPGEKRGTEVLAHYRQFFASGVQRPRHYVLNIEIHVETGDSASAKAYFLVTTTMGDDSQLGWGRYDDRLERRDGQWVFVLKQNLPSVYATLADGWAHGSQQRPWADK